MSEVEISPATDAERDWAAALMARSDPWITLGRDVEHCRRILYNPEYLVYTARHDQAPCGFIVIQRRGIAGSPYLASIAVAEAYRGTGVGSRLLEFFEGLFRSEARDVFLCVSSFNPRARALYERCGYRQAGEFKDYIIQGASEILMQKRLVP